MPKYTLHYFDARGRAEISRMILAAGDIQYTDHRIQFQDWPALKQSTPLGQLPYLEIDNIAVPQSLAIARYFAKEVNIAGKNNLEQLQVDAVVDTTADAINEYIQKVFLLPDAEKKEAELKFLNENLPKHLSNLDKLYELYGQNGYAVGNSLTWADLLVYEVFISLEKKASLAEKCKFFAHNKQIVESHPKLGPYLKSCPETPF